MTDEEMAEEYAHNHLHYEVAKRKDGTDYAKEVSDVTIKQAFLAGLKAKTVSIEEQLEYAKTIIQDLLDNSDEYARQRAMDFLEVKEK